MCLQFIVFDKRQEGVHQGIYKVISVIVTTITGEMLQCRCYQQIQDLDADRRPSIVYKNIMIQGARQNQVPEEYITNTLEAIIDNGYDGEVQVSLDLLKKL